MRYQNREIEVISKRKTFGKVIVQIRILATCQILDVPETELTESKGVITSSELSFKAMAARIRNEINTQKLLSPFESNIVPLPHQILALEKVMGGSYLRYLMADEVGMGKTIETGLVLKELKLRGIVKRTLIIVPLSAMQQWRQELKKHFNETFHIYESDYINTLVKTFSRLEADNEINIWSQHNQIIVSMDALKPIETRQGWSKEKVEEYNRFRIQNVIEANFDLLVIDECHKVGGGSNLVARFQMAQILSDAIPNVLLLSATPHRGKSDHFRRILSLLDADAFSGEGMPPISELEPYVVRTEKRQAIDYNGKKLFNKRNTERVVVPYDADKHFKQRGLYSAVTEYIINGFNLAQQTKNTSYGFVMVLFQRMMSSSTQAILDSMERRAARLSMEQQAVNSRFANIDLEELNVEGELYPDFEEQVNAVIQETQLGFATELEILKGLINQAKDCIASELDAKLDYLLQRLSALKKTEENDNLKFIIFTEFTSTQFMLKRELEQRGGFICETINGSMDFDERLDALKKFKEQAHILISTDAAGESLNMQFAHIVINYDMPWNPMVLEQRIGRVDRIGQMREVLAINLMLDNSIDLRVYEVIETKLNQILEELGIDKTQDVLDSTLERDSVNSLFLASLLDPAKFESESKNWLNQIKNKLKDYKSTEGALPTLDSKEIKTEKTDSIKYSPLPSWLETLTISYLESKSVNYQKSLDGLIFTYPGRKEQIYNFNAKDNINNPIPEALTLQHEIIKEILSEAVPITESSIIPHISAKHEEIQSGYWTLWLLKASNGFETHEVIHPLYITDEGDIFTTYATDFWNKLSSRELEVTLTGTSNGNISSILNNLTAKAEEILGPKYNELENKTKTNSERIYANKEKAYEFQERQLKRIGIENIKNARLNALNRERKEWKSGFASASQVVPDLTSLMIIRVNNE